MWLFLCSKLVISMQYILQVQILIRLLKSNCRFVTQHCSAFSWVIMNSHHLYSKKMCLVHRVLNTRLLLLCLHAFVSPPVPPFHPSVLFTYWLCLSSECVPAILWFEVFLLLMSQLFLCFVPLRECCVANNILLSTILKHIHCTREGLGPTI